MHRQNLKKILFLSTKKLIFSVGDKIKKNLGNKILLFPTFRKITVGGLVNQLIKKFWPKTGF